MASKKQSKSGGIKSLSTNNYIALVAVGTALIVIICGFIVNALAHKLILDTKVIAGKSKAKQALDVKVQNAPKLVDAYHGLGDRKQLIQDALPNDPDFAELNTIIENMGAASGVRVKSISPATGASSDGSSTAAPTSATTGAAAPASAAPGASTSAAGSPATPQPFSFEVTVQGPYARIVDFSRNVELSARPMKVTSVSLQGTADSVSADLKITTYYQAKADISDKKEPVK